jgi:hypothetical protein
MALETDEFDLDVAGEIEGTDKSSAVSFCWDYLSHYQELFVPWKNEAINLIEVGIQTGRSLKVWEAYFPRATIVGLDIDQNCTRFANNRTVIEIGSQADPGILHRVTAKYPPTIFIDDGSHLATHIIYTFERVFPSLLPGGLYIVEDLALHLEEDGEKWNGGSPTAAPNYFLDLAKLCMVRTRHGQDSWGTRRYLGENIATIGFIGGAVVIKKVKGRDFARAIRFGTEYLRSRGEPAEGYGRMAEYLVRHGGPADDAEWYVRRAVELGGENLQLLLLRADILSRQERLSDAASLLQRSCELHPERAEVWQRLAQVEGRLAHHDAAVTAMQHAASLRPGDPNTCIELSFFLERAGKLEEALKAAEESVAVADGSPAADRCRRHLDHVRTLLRTSIA